MRAGARYTILVVLVLAAAAAVYADTSRPPDIAAIASPSPVEVPAASRGSAFCVPLAAEGEGARVTMVAVDEPAAVEVVLGGAIIEETPVAPDSPTIVELPPDQAGAPVTLRWDGAPIVAAYETTGEGPHAVASCAATTEPRWHLAGFTTTLGNHASLHLFNPFSIDAVARVRYATPDGAVDLVTTQDLAVPAGEAVVVDLDDVQPEVADLGVIVDVLTGRLVAAGQMRFGPPDEEVGSEETSAEEATEEPPAEAATAPDNALEDENVALEGRTALAGVPEPSLDHMFPYAAADGGTAQGWVSIMNPDPEREAVVLIGVSTPDPAAPVQSELSVPSGSTLRVELGGLSERPIFGAAVTVVNDVAVVATRYAARRVDDRTAVDAATAPTPGDDWLVLGPGADDGTRVVDVFNPGGQPVTVAVDPLHGVGTGATEAAVPAEWASTVIEPNSHRGFPLSDLQTTTSALPVRVRADGPLVAGMRAADEQGVAAGFRTLAGFPTTPLSRPQKRPSLVYIPELHREPLPTPTATP